MAKRPTIGKNPLDTLVSENHLDVLVPDLLTTPPKERGDLKQENVEKLKERLMAQEAEIQALRDEMVRLQGKPGEAEPGKAKPAESRDRPTAAEPRWVALQRLGEK